MQNRIKSFIWRSGMMTLAFLVVTLSENIGLLELGPTATMVLGLILGEVSKYLNTQK
jgi:hypothetical protein